VQFLSRSLLLVLNDDRLSFDIAQLFTNSGFQIFSAGAGQKPLEFLRQEVNIDLVLMDDDLNAGSTVRIAEEILNLKEVPIIFLLTRTEEAQVQDLENVTHYGCLPKAADGTIILSAVKAALKLFKKITDQKIRQKELQSSQLHLREVLETTNDGVFSLDRNWRFTFLNTSAGKMVNRVSEDLSGKVIWEEFPEAINTQFAKMYHDAMEQGISARVEEFYPPMNGWFEISAYPNSEGISVYYREITERKMIEEELEKQYNFFEQMFIQSATSTQILDKDGWCLRINPKLGELFGVKPKDIEGRVYNVFKDAEIIKTGIDKILRNVYDRKQVEYWEVHFDVGHAAASQNIPVTEKKKVWISNKAYPIVNQNGELLYVIIQHEDIKERKQSEAALLEREELFRTIFENTTTGVCLVDSCAKFIRVNETFRNMIGYSDEELKSIDSIDITYDEDKQTGLGYYNQLLTAQLEKASYEIRLLRKDGNIIWCYVSISLVREISLKPKYFIAHVQDITERKKAKQLLKESEEQLRTIFENAVLGIYRTTPDGRILKVNNALCRKLGYSSPEELMKRNLEQEGFQPNYSRASFKEHFNDNKEYVCLETQWNKADGSTIYVRENAKAVRDKSGNILFYDGTVEDITERKLAEDALIESEKKYRLLFENNPVPMWIYNLRTLKFLEVNKAAVEHYGYTRDEFLSMTIRDIRPDSDLDLLMNFLQRTEAEYKNTSTWRHLKKNGDIIYVDINSHTIDYEGEKARLVLSNDITERKLSQEDLIRAKKEAEKSDQLKSEFLAQMSHEIRSPISTMLNFISLIKESVAQPLNEEMAFSFNAIDSSSRRLIRTIDLILNMSQIQTGYLECSFEIFDLEKNVLRNIINEYSTSAQLKGLTLKISNENGSAAVNADLYTVTQIFSNLIHNAIKYTRTGEISVRIYHNAQSKLSVDVADTGIGISEEYIAQIFTPFSQEEQGYTRKFEGNGLGLALVKKYCELNHIEISVKSVKGEGSTFTVVFSD